MWLAPADALCHWASYYPSRIAVQIGETSISYLDLASRAFEVAARIPQGIKIQGGRPRCAVVCWSKLDFLAAAYGAMFARCSLVVVNPILSTPDLSRLLVQTNTKCVICDVSILSQVRNATDVVPGLVSPISVPESVPRVVSQSQLLSWKLTDSRGALDEEWGLVFSSGSTGIPKGIVQSHMGVISESIAWCIELQLCRTTRFFVGRPLFYTGGLVLFLACHTVGATLLLPDGDDNNTEATVSALEEAAKLGKVDWAFFIPEQARSIVRRQRAWSFQANPASVLLMGSKTSGDEKQRLSEFFGSSIVESWGNSEGLGTITDLDDLVGRPESIGRPFIGEHVFVVNENCESVPNNCVGRIVGAEDTMFVEYAGAPDSTASTKRDGLILSGDVGFRDDSGHLYILGRTDDVVNLKDGAWLTVDAIERPVLQLPFVKDAAAIISEFRGGIKAGLFVLLENDLESKVHLTEIESTARAALCGRPIVITITLVEAIPRLASGKTDRVTIRRMMGWG